MENLPQQGREACLAHAISALHQTHFAALLADYLHQCMAFDNFILIAYCGEANPVSLYQRAKLPRVFEAFDSDYATAAYVLDPCYQMHLKKAPSGFYRLHDVAPDQFTRSRFFEAYYRRTTLTDEIVLMAHTRSGVTLMACVGKDQSSGGGLFPRSSMTGLERYAGVAIALMEHNWAELEFPRRDRLSTRPPLLERLVELLHSSKGILLTPRQAQVALLILQGHSSKSIAATLEISPQTVKVFRKQLYARCEISSQAELFALLVPIMAEISGDSESESRA